MSRDTLRVLVEWWNPTTDEVWPSVATLGARLGLTRRTVQLRLRRLEAGGVICVVENAGKDGRAKGGRGRSGRYRIDWTAVDQVGKGAADCAVSEAERAQSNASKGRNGLREKGAIHCAKRAQPIAPEQTTGTNKMNLQGNSKLAAACPAAAQGGGVAAAAVPVEALRIAWGKDADRLLRHPNATPERLAWIAREAPSKKKPGGWARRAIEEGWSPRSRGTVSKVVEELSRRSTAWKEISAEEQDRLINLALSDPDIRALPQGHDLRVAALVSVLRAEGLDAAAQSIEASHARRKAEASSETPPADDLTSPAACTSV